LSWLQRLWTPWRMAYIKNINKEKKCFICEAVLNPDKLENLVVYINKLIVIMLNKYPYNSGHILIAPNRHIKNLEEVTEEEWKELVNGILIGKKILDNVYKPQGYNVGINLGKVAGAGLEDHLHIHIVPRWAGDTSFMTTISNTKVIPQSLEESLKELRDEILKLNIK